VSVIAAGDHASMLSELSVPPLVVTATVYVPAAFAGIVKTIVVASLDVTVADVPPTVTVAPVRRVPVIVMDSPPAVSAWL
jgi:hypothetical protein